MLINARKGSQRRCHLSRDQNKVVVRAMQALKDCIPGKSKYKGPGVLWKQQGSLEAEGQWIQENRDRGRGWEARIFYSEQNRKPLKGSEQKAG